MPEIISIEKLESPRSRGRREDVRAASPSPRRSRVRVTLENGEALVLRGRRADAVTALGEGADLPEDQYTEILQEQRSSCMLRCGSLLGSRDYSEQRLRDKLSGAGYPGSVIEECVGKLRDAGYLNDGRYAANYVRSHLADRSRLRITRDLLGRGISEEDIATAFEAAAEESDPEELQIRQIRRLLEKRRFDPSTADYPERQKTMAFLSRKGYSMDLIRRGMESPGV
ncbi:MAG: regulatory protein RecX [Eubacteriales bacterium]|nr:regulatory protein RecX [Eubacteriales bacterium]